MGQIGIISCFLSNFLSFPGYLLLGCCLRRRVIQQYNINDMSGKYFLIMINKKNYFILIF
jgi:hypothetical protein